MKLEVLGCSGDVSWHRHTTAYLVNDTVLFDAGTVTEVLSARRTQAISHVFLSHSHLDHVYGLCSLTDQGFMGGGRRVTVLADKQVLHSLSRFIFNNHVWPDFTTLENKEGPIMHLQRMPKDRCVDLQGLQVTAIPVKHRVYTTGFLIREKDKAIMITSDTSKTEHFWEVAQSEVRIDLIIAHVAFPNRLAELAEAAGHMTPDLLFQTIDAYGLTDTRFCIAHMKSIFEKEICAEIRAASRRNVEVLMPRSVLSI